MNSKQRVLKTLMHQEPDRVPTGEHGIDHDHVSNILGRHTYWRNRKDTTIAIWEGRRDEVVESMKYDYEELIQKLDYDILTVDIVPPKGYICEDPPKKIADGVWENKKGEVFKYAASNDSIMCVTPRPEKEELTEVDLEKAKRNIDKSQFEVIDYFGDKYGDEKAVLCRALDVFEVLTEPFGGDFSYKLIVPTINPDEVKKVYDVALDYNRQIIEHCAKHKIALCHQSSDFGMNTGCMMSPMVINDVFFPFMKMLNDEIYKNNMLPSFHCCGQITDILSSYIEAGYVSYQSVQASAGMVAKDIKAKYGDKLSLWAGIQCETLVDGSMYDVIKEVETSLVDLMPGGGFVFGSTNSVQYGAKTENYLKALEIVNSKGIYK